ncbi:hypothetical protein [Amnibacterium sp.]|uniref:hypothetical protein n=1 Tax=Amnibacterium sp. TaxID=1872496 RepID=UPI003F7C214B
MSLDAATIARLAAEAVEAAPAPERVEDLDAQTRRAVERGAEAAGVSPATFWAASRSAAAASAETADEARRIAERIRR